MRLQFRPHHFLCALCFQGRGYSPAFISNFKSIMQELNSGQGAQSPINIINHTDSICSPCPKRSHKSCESEEKINRLDHAHETALSLHPGDTITWEQAKNRIATHLTLETFHRICADCSWKSLGICEKTLTEFLPDSNGEQSK